MRNRGRDAAGIEAEVIDGGVPRAPPASLALTGSVDVDARALIGGGAPPCYIDFESSISNGDRKEKTMTPEVSPHPKTPVALLLLPLLET